MATINFSGFSIKPIKKTRSRASTSEKVIKRILYCKPIQKEDTFYASINTKGIEGYEDVTILPFTKESFELKGRTDVFSINKDKTGRYVHIMRYKDDSYHNMDETKYTPFSINGVYKGHIVRHNDGLFFDMISYVGYIRDNERLLKGYSKEEL